MHTDVSLLDLEDEFFGSMLVIEPAEIVGLWWVLCECNEAFVFSAEELLGGAVCPPCSMPEVLDLAALEAQLPVFAYGHLDTSWMKGALCAEVGHHPFFPDAGDTFAPARKLCSDCEVQSECLTWGLESFDNYAILGGTTPGERKAMRTARGIVRAPHEPKGHQRKGLRGVGSGVHQGSVSHSGMGAALVGSGRF